MSEAAMDRRTAAAALRRHGAEVEEAWLGRPWRENYEEEKEWRMRGEGRTLTSGTPYVK